MTFENNTSFKNAAIATLFFVIVFGLLESIAFGIKNALIATPIAGICFGAAIYFFSKSRKINMQTELEGINESEIIYFGMANHFKGAEAVGGKLYLLKDKIVFKSHNFNIQKHLLDIPIQKIKKTSTFKTLGFIPNGLDITLKDGKIEKFVLNSRNIWETEIAKAIKA